MCVSRPGVRVALLTPAFWPEVKRGAERFVKELADGLLARGHQPRVVTSHRGRPSRSVEDGLPITRVYRPPRGGLERRGFEQYMTHVPFSYLDLRRGDDDVAQAVFPTDALAAARWSERTGRPSILSFMGLPDHPGLTSRRLRPRILAEATSRCDAVCTLSKTAADAFWRWMGVEARVIYPGVDLSVFGRAAPRAEEPTIFCAATPDEPRKRVPLLIEAFKLVRREHPRARLELLSPNDPADATRLRSVAPGIELLPQVEEPSELAARYSRAWVSALPSTGDSFGIVLAESLACGTPVVGSNRDAIPEVVDRDTIGRLFDGDERELSRALLEAIELARDPATEAACRARAEDFSTDRCVESYLALYAELRGA